MTDDVMKKRGLTKRKPLGNNVAVELWHALDDFASKPPKRNKSGLLDEAIVLLLQAYGEQVPEGKEALISHLADKGNSNE